MCVAQHPVPLQAPRGLAGVYRWFLELVPHPIHRNGGKRPAGKRDAPPELVARAQGSSLLSLMLITPETLAGMAVELPNVLTMSDGEAVARLTGLKCLLPACDVSHLVISEPKLYLGATRSQVEESLRSSLSLLVERFSIPPDVVQDMITHDPGLPWVVNERGLQELRQLWPSDLVDAQALQDSDPRELALAVRFLSSMRR
ncbi:hypothetical protein GPECTOR_82g251 [Gonium pectorale]|uniref:Uncharacterized protein n=1 Tax=Gonium pectorale TaxID=33097 RepID=A0A150G1J9_GONPE|nr:hypothetical protein GPECTOR_82g251 [Gonium pectorale]|eukprot:KXZ43717.1 hypothetical protein GPECTOR_82g251 [Gonium pectorale]